MRSMRLFIAIEVPRHIQKALNRIARALAEEVPSVRPVSAGNIHLTLHFLGDLTDEAASGIPDILSTAAAAGAPFSAAVSSLGSFGRRGSLSVIWAGVEESGALNGIQAELGAGLKRTSLQVDERPFFPHLTIARVRPGPGTRRLPCLLERYAGTEFGLLYVDRIHLVRSTLTPEGAVYETLASAPLNK